MFQVRQAIYDIRSKLSKTAVTYLNTRFKGMKLPEVKTAVARAVSETGELYYADTQNYVSVEYNQ
jgi:hypothetical protein